jgi:hypothetical protein
MAMRTVKYHLLRATAVLLALAGGAVLSFILLWLIGGRGYVACGRGVFDSPDWPLTVLILVGAPSGLLAAAVATIRYCSRRLAFR